MKYRTKVDLSIQNSSQAAAARLLLGRLRTGARILDVGCAAGDFGAVLASRGFEVVGIERDADAAEIASRKLAQVHVSDLEKLPLNEIVEGQFDAIVFGDVLEHLMDPEGVLQTAGEILTPDGLVVASIPNVAHGSTRINLAVGKWEYTDEGLLDRTHLRFFTLNSIKQLFADAGFVIDTMQATVINPLLNAPEGVPQDILNWLVEQENASDFQYIVEAHVGEEPPNHGLQVRRLETPLTVDTTYEQHHQKRESGLSEEKRRVEELERKLTETYEELRRAKDLLDGFEADRMRMLTLRDHAIGMEQSYGRAQYELVESTNLVAQLRRELIETHRHLAASIADSQQAHANLAEALRSVPLSSRIARKAATLARRAKS